MITREDKKHLNVQPPQRQKPPRQ